jgi:hypothetical protein
MDDSANKKSSYTIPRAHSIAFSALIAEFDGVSTCLFYAIYYHFEGG